MTKNLELTNNSSYIRHEFIKSNTIKANTMRLSKVAIMAIRGGKDMKKKLADALGVSDPTIYRWVSENDDNLTKAAALKVLREETGLDNDDLLETEVATSEIGH